MIDYSPLHMVINYEPAENWLQPQGITTAHKFCWFKCTLLFAKPIITRTVLSQRILITHLSLHLLIYTNKIVVTHKAMLRCCFAGQPIVHISWCLSERDIFKIWATQPFHRKRWKNSLISVTSGTLHKVSRPWLLEISFKSQD